jgi:hypothetical protein
MYLFSRQVRLAPGHSRAAMEWAHSQTERVNTITGLQVGLFMQVFSPQVGLIGWSTFVPDLTALESAADKLNVDDAMASATDSGAEYTTGGAHDRLAQVIYGSPDPDRQIEYVSVVHAVCASGNMMKGMELGSEIAARAEKITGTPGMFLADVTGTYGGVSWVSSHTDVHAMEAAQDALAGDQSFGKYIDKEVRGVYADDPSLTTQLIYRRLA